MKGKKILITGILGFIGSNLAEELISQGATIVGIDDGSTGKLSNIEGFEQNLFLFKGDVNSFADVSEVFDIYGPFDYIFHMAAMVGVKKTEESPLAVLADAYGSVNLIAKIGNAKTKIVFASSSEVYGHTKPPSQEEGFLDVRTPYQVVKKYEEEVMTACNAATNISAMSVRYFNVYGKNQVGSEYGFVISKFIQQALNDEPITIYGDGTQTRDFSYIKDVIALTIEAAKSTKTNGQNINIGTGKETAIKELAQQIEKIIRPNHMQQIYSNDRKQEIKHRCANTKKMKKLLGTMKYSLKKGLKETIRYYINKEIA